MQNGDTFQLQFNFLKRKKVKGRKKSKGLNTFLFIYILYGKVTVSSNDDITT